MRIIGIDYSLTSPAICFHEGKSWNPSNAKFYFFVGKEKDMVTDPMFFSTVYPKYENQQERYEFLAKWAADIAKENFADFVFIEGYAFGAKGRVFHIAENCGVMKQKLWTEFHLACTELAPSEVKKSATGSGNANKEKMVGVFETETGIELRHRLGISKPNVWNPVSDIADAYHVCKLGFERITHENQQKELLDGKNS